MGLIDYLFGGELKQIRQEIENERAVLQKIKAQMN